MAPKTKTLQFQVKSIGLTVAKL